MTIVTGIEQPPFDFRPNGASLVEKDQRDYLEGAGHQVFTVRPAYPEVKADLREVHVSSIKLPEAENYRIAWPFDPLTQRSLESWLRKLRPDLVYLHGPYQVAAKLAAIAKKLSVPYVMHMHTHISGYVESRVPEVLWPVAKKLALNRAKRLAEEAALTIFPSETYRNVFTAETGFSGSGLVFPSFIKPFTLMQQDEKERFNYLFRQNHFPENPNAYPAIVVHGRLEKEKNPKYSMLCFMNLLRVLKELPIDGVEYPVMIYVGGGVDSCKDELMALARENGIVDKVYFAGCRPNEESRQILQIANQCWFLSNTETQGIVPLEAGFAGIPVFGLKGEPFDEFFGSENSLSVPGTSPLILALRSHTLLADKKRYSEMAEHCRRVSGAFSDIEKYKNSFLEICENVVTNSTKQ